VRSKLTQTLSAAQRGVDSVAYKMIGVMQQRSRRIQITAAALMIFGALLPDSAFAQAVGSSSVFGGATSAAQKIAGQGLNVLLGIVTMLGGVGMGTGLIGHFKDPEKKKMWDRVFELSLIPLVGGAIALGYFNNAGNLTSALGTASTSGTTP
jgi:hypothetical protein